MTNLLTIAQELDIKIIFDDMDEPGLYVSVIDTIIINSNLAEEEQKLVLLHELAHAKKHREQACLYNRSFSNHSKMEAEANQFMLHSLIEENDCAFNYTNVVENFGLCMGEEEILKKNKIQPYLK